MPSYMVAKTRREASHETRRGALLSVVVTSPQPLFITGIEALLENEPDLTVVGRYASIGEMLDEVKDVRPALALVDVDLAHAGALDIVRKLRDAAPHTKLCLVAERVDGDCLVEAVRLGVRGVFLKSTQASVIREGLRHVLDGYVWCEPELMASALQRIVEREAIERRLAARGLTPREVKIATLAREGLSVGAIAGQEHISPATVRTHVYNVSRKLGLSGRGALSRSVI
jgi:two-component system, NarL family, nitrate/nitrite response regulator NarL